MHRTQIYLEEGQFQLLRALARREGKSLAAVIREILDAHLSGASATAADPLDGLLGIGVGDGSAVAENSDDYLYGDGS